MECGIKDALLKHMMQNYVISPNQHGFILKKSTTSQLLEFKFDIASDLKKDVLPMLNTSIMLKHLMQFHIAN